MIIKNVKNLLLNDSQIVFCSGAEYLSEIEQLFFEFFPKGKDEPKSIKMK